MESGNGSDRDLVWILGNNRNCKRRSKEEIEDYNRRIEEVFKKHGLVPKRVSGKGYKVIFLKDVCKNTVK